MPMKPKWIALTDQRNDEIVVLDLSSKDFADPVWRWSPTGRGDLSYPGEKNRRLDSFTLRKVNAGLFHGPVAGVTKSGGMVAVVEYPSGKCLFNVDASGYGPHDIDILPNGCVAVACSGNGNAAMAELRVYRAGTKDEDARVSVPLPGVHGVLWDPSLEILWCLSYSELRAYRISLSFEGMPILSRVKDRGVGGLRSGYCLSPVYGAPDRLWITDADGVYQYSKSMDTFCDGYPGKSKVCIPSVKSINSYADGTLVMTVADGKRNATAPHNTDTVRILVPDKTGEYVSRDLKFENRDFYKVRIFDPSYQ